ncbi:hypothetical protein [Bizionia arctica]|uniref:Uncharacterized protein n=1 Tax=Bizionia arctica TaxID=1495645 RepID=A0A917LJH1_9FLAO|nr:hypothetical protein [Bizionia arctica]GGG32268.1 hypothetical protein GCM10010976_00080 [Bizionia arctica]
MKETLDQIYDEIAKRLYIPMIFYIPRRIWNQFDKEKWEDKIFDNVFDKVVIVKPDGSDILLEDAPSYFHLLIKKERLDKSTFKLLNLQPDLEEKQFNFLLNKYCLQLDFFRRVSKWMVENIQQDVKEINNEILMSFELQQTTFEEHWQYIQENFVDAPKIKEIKADSILSTKDFESFQDLMKPTGILSRTIDVEVKNEKVVLKPKRSKKEKKILVTEEEATDFLLKTVFNMKL